VFGGRNCKENVNIEAQELSPITSSKYFKALLMQTQKVAVIVMQDYS